MAVSIKRKLFYSLLATVLTIFILEIALRSAGYRCKPAPENMFEMDLYDPHHRLDDERLWVLHPNKADQQINEHGFRSIPGQQISMKKPQGEFRLAFLGDSSTFGWMVGRRGNAIDLQQTYSHRVEALLNGSSRGGVTFRSLNFGVPGYSTFQGRLHLKHLAIKYQPDLILTYFWANDFSPARTPDSESVATYRLRHRLMSVRLFQLFSCCSRWFRRGVKEGSRPPPPAPHLVNTARVPLREYVANINDMDRQARAIKARLVFVAYMFHEEKPNKEGHRIMPFLENGELQRAGLRADIPYIELVKEMRAALKAGVPLFSDSCHPTPEGHDVMARALVDALRRRRLVPD